MFGPSTMSIKLSEAQASNNAGIQPNGARDGKRASLSKPSKWHSHAGPRRQPAMTPVSRKWFSSPTALKPPRKPAPTSHPRLTAKQFSGLLSQLQKAAASPGAGPGSVTDGAGSPTKESQNDKMRRRARRFRGGRMGGGTRGWGYGENKGDSDDEAGEDEGEPVPEQPAEKDKDKEAEDPPILRLGVPPFLESRHWFHWSYTEEDANRVFWKTVRKFYPQPAEGFRLCVRFGTDSPDDHIRSTPFSRTLDMEEPVPVDEMIREHQNKMPDFLILTPYLDKIRFVVEVPWWEKTVGWLNVDQPPVGKGAAYHRLMTALGKETKAVIAELCPGYVVASLKERNSGREVATIDPQLRDQDVAQSLFATLTSRELLVSAKAAEDIEREMKEVEAAAQAKKAVPAKKAAQVENPSPRVSSRRGAPQATTKSRICHVALCHANLEYMTELERADHANMHAIADGNELERNSLTEQRSRNEAEIARLQAALLDLQTQYDADAALLVGALKVLGEQDAAGSTTAAPVQEEATSSKASPKKQSKRKAAVSKDDKTKIAGTTASKPAAADTTAAEPPALPSSVSVPATRQEMYDSAQYTNSNLQSLFKGGYRVCNVCLGWCKGYKDFGEHARSCSTSPWNFVATADKKSLPAGKTRFAHRFPESEGPIEVEDTAERAAEPAGDEAPADSIEVAAQEQTGQGKKRKQDKSDDTSPKHHPTKKRKESQAAYREPVNEMNSDSSSDELPEMPNPQARKWRRSSQAPYRDTRENDD